MGTGDWSSEGAAAVRRYESECGEKESDQSASCESSKSDEETDITSVEEDLGSCTMSVEELRFSQAGISDRFRNGRRILSIMHGLRDNKIRVQSLPLIKVFLKDGQWFSADNRRLWCFKETGLERVPVRRMPP